MNKRYLFLVLLLALSSFLYFANAQKLTKERQLALKKAELNIKDLYNELNAAQYNLSFTAFRYAYIGYQSMRKQRKLNDKDLFSIIDFTKDCNTKRFYTIDLEKMKILYYTYVAHGKKSGERIPTSFSDVVESNKSSIGFYITGRSLGCPVLPENIYKQVINTIKEKTMIFAYYNDAKYLKTSKYLNLLKLIENTDTESVF